MTVAAVASQVVYLGNGTAAPLAVPFRFLELDDLVVTSITLSGVRSVLTRGVDYSVAGAGGTSGTVTPLAPVPVNTSWEIRRRTPRAQTADYVTGDPFPAETHELALDRMMLVAQELDVSVAEIVARAVRVLPGETIAELPAASLRASKYFVFDALGNSSVSSGTGTDAGLRTDMATSAGAGLIGFIQAGIAAILRTVQAKLRDTVSVMDFGAVGDGVVNDGAAINLALVTGKDVFFPSGMTFNIDGVTLIPVAGQRLFGGGRLVKSTTATDITLVGAQDAPRFIKIESKSNIDIDGIEFQYTGLVTPRVYGVTIEAGTNCTVRNCRFIGTETPCFIWKNSIGTVFEGNKTTGGVFGVATGGDAAGNTNGPVTNTTIRGNYLSGAISEGVDLNWDTQGCLVEGNFLIDNNMTAAEDDIDIGGGTCFDIIVSNNVIDSGGRSTTGVNIKLNTSNVKVVGNNIGGGLDASASIGVRVQAYDGTLTVHDVEVIGNTISGFNKGVEVAYGANHVKVAFNNIGGLRAAANSNGIDVYGTSATNAAVVNNVEIFGNTINGGDLAGGSGVNVDDCTTFSISHNRIYGMGADGITLLSPSTGGRIIGNEISGCDDGIVSLATDTLISENIIRENDKHGLNIQGVRTTVTGNHIYNNANLAASDGIVLTAGANFAVITGNNIYDNQGTKTQRYGINVTGASDRCIINGNLLYGNLTGAINNSAALTNSLVGVAGNITA